MGTALSYESSVLHVSLVPLGMKAAHDPIVTAGDLWEEAEVPRANEVREAREHPKAS